LVICKMPNRTFYSVFSFLRTLHSSHITVSLCSMSLLFKSHWRPNDTRCVETGFPIGSVNSPVSPNTVLTT
jgi:hypothetical protein